MPTLRPQRTPLSPALLWRGGGWGVPQEPPSLCLMKAWGSLTSSLSPFPSNSPLDLEAWSTPLPTRAEGVTVALGVTPLDSCLRKTVWLGELQDVDGGWPEKLENDGV